MVMGCLGEMCEELFAHDTEQRSRCVREMRSVFVGGCVQMWKTCTFMTSTLI